MYKKLVVALAIVGLVVSSSSIVVAQTNNVETTPLVTGATDIRAQDRKARLEGYKREITDRFTAEQKLRIKNRCKNAQQKIVNRQQRIDALVKKRKGVYRSLQAKLDNLSKRLEEAEIDTTGLQNLQEDLTSEVDKLVVQLDNYKLVLLDLSEMDCQADTDGFKAALETARNLNSDLKNQATELRNFIKNDLKNILQNIRDQLIDR